MKGLALLVFLSVHVAAIHLVNRGSSPSTVSLKTQRRHIERPVNGNIIRRTEPVPETLDNRGVAYTARLSLGTPPQEFIVIVDTGSSDLWVNTLDSEFCSYGLCGDAGTYDANASDTYAYRSSDFFIRYADGTTAGGDYATDTVRVGENTQQELTDLQFGIAYNSTFPVGLLGIGYTANVAQAQDGSTYPNLPQLLVDQGVIQSNAYSLWLDDIESNTGSILFGGVDTDKYQGTLQTFPIQRMSGEYRHFVISLSGLSLSNGRNQSFQQSLPTAVLLDSGSSITYLPEQLAAEVYAALDIQIDPLARSGYVEVDCSLANSEATLNFAFTSVTIAVPMSELVLPGGRSSRLGCLFGLASANGTVGLFGDTFLRSAYVVYDLENNEISLAQTNFDSTTSTSGSTTSSVREIGKGRGSVPGASAVANPVQAPDPQAVAPRVGRPTTATGAGAGAGDSGTEDQRASSAASEGKAAVLLVVLGCSTLALAFAFV
ncbi:MAG: hypothetical protein Q9209_003232 [Squamulea sp. 1 TL-2023]